MSRRSVLVLAVLLGIGGFAQAEVRYSITDLGTLGGKSTIAYSINDFGQIVGESKPAQGYSLPFIWLPAQAYSLPSGMSCLGTLGGDFGEALGINNSGEVVGTCTTTIGGFQDHSFMWKDGALTDLGPIHFNDINDAGQLAGSHYLKSGDSLTTLLPASGFDSCVVYALNNLGDVVGISFVNGSSNIHACLWRNGVPVDIGIDVAGMQSTGLDVNDLGQVVGYFWSNGERGFVWDNGAVTEVGGWASEAVAINNVGQVVGMSGSYRAFLWDEGVTSDLNNLADVPVGWTLTYAQDINNRGQIIAWGNGPDAAQHSFLLTPGPNPPTTIGALKSVSDGELVSVSDAVVTATTVVVGSVYVESPDRSSGIRVVTERLLALGDRVKFKGSIRHVDGECQVYCASASSFSEVTAGSPLAPVGVTTATIGSDPTEKLDYSGINMTGMLVRMAGKVTGVGTAQHIVYVDDGRHYQDGTFPVFGIRVYLPEGISLPDKGKKVVVTGICRVEKYTLLGGSEVNGDLYPVGTVIYVPTIWLRDSADWRILN